LGLGIEDALMVARELRTMDYLDWLKNQEEFLLWQLSFLSPADSIDEGEELQLVREIKELVTNYVGRNNDGSDN
jgi:hypothetical protein